MQRKKTRNNQHNIKKEQRYQIVRLTIKLQKSRWHSTGKGIDKYIHGTKERAHKQTQICS